jgi:recombinational DNA repair protein (RecF pathway)
MPHALHHTDAFILGVHQQGEANSVLDVLAREHGRISLHAQGLRRLESKLRFHVRTHDFATLSMVAGRQWWRLTGAAVCTDAAQAARQHGAGSLAAKRALSARVALLLKRLVTGVEADSELYEIVRRGLNAAGTLPPDDVQSLELVLVMRILDRLGHLRTDEHTRPFLRDCMVWDALVRAEAQRHRSALILRTNEALHASGL